MRIIAKMDIKPPYLVKPVHFEGLRKYGDPASRAMYYCADDIDEIIYVDIVASLYRRKPDLDLIRRVAESVNFVPFSVGGGLAELGDALAVLESGADKVCINTSAIHSDGVLLKELSDHLGSQSVTANIEVKELGGSYWCYTDGGRINHNIDLDSWVAKVQDCGAGEILVQSVDKDGRQRGFDLNALEIVMKRAEVPVLACSGAGTQEHVEDLVKNIGPDAVVLASSLLKGLIEVQDVRKIISRHTNQGKL